MTFVGDAAIERLRRLDDCPDLSGTRYELCEEIGRGGMGIVFRGNQLVIDSAALDRCVRSAVAFIVDVDRRLKIRK